jgi:autotransporter-associated beta strand protein
MAVGNTSFRINDPANALDVYAISRDSVGNFIAFETGASFSLENITGSLAAGDLVDNGNGTATFSAQNLGTGIIRASFGNLADGDSGIITVEEPQFRWTAQGIGSWGNTNNWLDNTPPFFDNTTDLFFMDEFAVTAQTFLNGDRTVRSLNFTEFADPTVTQPFFGIRYLTNNSPGLARNLTLDTDSPVNPAEINIAAGAEINIDLGNVNNGFIPNLPENYGNLILADPLLITHLGSGSLIFSRPIVEVPESEEAMSVTIDETSTGTVVFREVNTYTGPTTVNGGTLRLLNGEAIGDSASLAVNGGLVEIEADEIVGNLFIDGVRKAPGIYGSTSSIAPVENQDDTKFSGLGSITVVGVPVESGTLEILSIRKTDTQVTLTWTSNPGETYSVFASLDLQSFGDEIEDGVPAAAAADTTEYTFPLGLIDNPTRAFFKVSRN